MKKLLFYFISLSFFVLMSCTKEDGVNPPPGEKAINEIVTALENKEEISDFVEILKKVDVANLTEDKLTVFAVRNSSSAARSTAVLDSVSIKRHIAKGSYAKADLTDGKELESINGEKLYITRNGDEVYVNGVIIEGEAIPAGNSYVYIVPEVLEEKTEAETFYTTTINIRELTWGQAQDKPLEGVNVVVNEAVKDSLDRWTEGEFIGEWKTDANGQVIVKHTANEIVFWVYKDGYTDRYEGYVFEGVGSDGKFIIDDSNMDGLVNNDDKYFFNNNYYVGNDKGETESTGTAYMVAIDSEGVELPLPEPSSVENLWKERVYYYMSENVYLDSRLTKGTDLFRYNSIDFTEASLNYWKSAYSTIDWGLSCIESLENDGQTDLANKIRTDVYLIWTQLFGYY
ncbi:fasciclin domain-containing protein, partial [Bacteroides caecigallinarum]|uniref:fasciclin domain-containing protein n=1 Tax=Bacteroides caecigallinarum TaxID=1411144 RepID=UPI001F376749